MSTRDADMAAMCIFYLRDANHQFAHTVISVFYAKLLRAQGNITTTASTSLEFLSVCKATAAFSYCGWGRYRDASPDSWYIENVLIHYSEYFC
ncbi:MAG: hypothetical protein IPG64_27885 [Haliea sp.]|nr:hypothetical protein [Haliea sp.]